MMKKALPSLILAVSIVCSCTKNDSPPPPETDPDPVIISDSTKLVVIKSRPSTEFWSYTCLNPDLSFRWKKDSVPLALGLIGYHNNIVYLPGYKKTTAVDANTGKEIWSSAESLDYVVGRNDTLYCGGSYGGGFTISSLNAKTGEVYWRQPTYFPYHSVRLTLDGGEIYFLTAISNYGLDICAIDLKTRRIRTVAKTNLRSSKYGSLYIKDNLLFINGSTGLDAVNKNTGAIAFNIPGDYSVPVVKDTFLYAMENSTAIYAFSAKDGHNIWRMPTAFAYSEQGLTVTDDDVYFCWGKIISADRFTGAVKLDLPSDNSIFGSAAIGNTLYVTDFLADPRKISVLNTKTNQFEYSMGIPGEVAPGSMMVVSTKGAVGYLN